MVRRPEEKAERLRSKYFLALSPPKCFLASACISIRVFSFLHQQIDVVNPQGVEEGVRAFHVQQETAEGHIYFATRLSVLDSHVPPEEPHILSPLPSSNL